MAPFDLLAEYHGLLKAYGRQYWWPIYRATSCKPQAASRTRIRPEPVEGRPGCALQRRPYPRHLTEEDRFQICIGAILTQNTAWTNVELALSALARAAPCSPRRFVSLPYPSLAHIIRPAGYFNQKAKKLHIFSRWLLERYGGSLARFFRQPTERCRAELLSLWGIGPETADSMLLYAGRHPVFVIDAYTRRWLKVSKVELRTYAEYQRFFMDRLPHDAQLFNEFHALIVAWGKQFGSRKVVVEKIESGNRK